MDYCWNRKIYEGIEILILREKIERNFIFLGSQEEI